MWGTDWPVCKGWTTYDKTLSVIRNDMNFLNEEDKSWIFPKLSSEFGRFRDPNPRGDTFREAAADSFTDNLTWKRMNYRIFLKEDDLTVAKTIEYALKTIGCEVTHSVHGRDAIKLFELIDPDLVITDVILPEADTFDMIGLLRRFHPAAKILAISGNPHLLMLAAKHGANHVLPKPFDVNRLNMLVKVMLA